MLTFAQARAAKIAFRTRLGTPEDYAGDIDWWTVCPAIGPGKLSGVTVTWARDVVKLDHIASNKAGSAGPVIRLLIEVAKEAGYPEIILDNRTFSGFWEHFGFVKQPAPGSPDKMVLRLS